MSQFFLSSVVNGAQALLMLDSRCPFWVNVSLWLLSQQVTRAMHIYIVYCFPLSWQLEDSVRRVRSGDGASGITGVFSCGCLCSARLSCCLFCFLFTRTVQPFDNIQSLPQYSCVFLKSVFLLNSGWNVYFFWGQH